MRTSNPVLNDRMLAELALPSHEEQAMTAQGAATKTLMLLGLALITAAWTWRLFYGQATLSAGAQAAMPWMIGGLIGGLVFGLVTSFKMTWAPVTAPIYALCEGLFLGGLSAVLEAAYPTIVIQAVGLTFGTAFCMLLAYKLGLVRATERFKTGVMAATGAIALVYLISLLGNLLFHWQMPYLHDSSPLGIAISGVIVVIAALNLVLDFDFIEAAAAQGAPKSYEWYGAFGLMVTLVWLYLEILRLLSKLRSRD